MESEKRYDSFPAWENNDNGVWEHTQDGAKRLTNGEVRDRLNALEAERDALLVRAKAYERLIDSAGYDVRVLTGYKPLGGGDDN